MESSALVILRDVAKHYGALPVLADLNLDLPRGKVIGLLGPNGSGKTTLLKLLAGLLTPTAGCIEINGVSPGIESKRCVSYLPERTYFDNRMRVSDVVSLFERFYADFDAARAWDSMQRLGISAEARLRTLSKGTKEKVQLILVMSRRAALYLLDEPIGGVDPAAREYILQTILGNRYPESTILISTHLIRDVEPVLDEFCFLQNGQIRLYDTVAAVHAQGETVDELFREVFRC